MIKNIKVNDFKILVETSVGNYRGEYYIKNGEIYLRADNWLDLVQLGKRKKEIFEVIKSQS